jgi:succinate dehydrogenase/fumarate reductase cytochrome b subunit
MPEHKTRWISMFSPAKLILEEYKNLVVHIFYEHAFNATTKANLELLCEIEIFMCLTCVKYHFLNACRTFPSLDESTLTVSHFVQKR